MVIIKALTITALRTPIPSASFTNSSSFNFEFIMMRVLNDWQIQLVALWFWANYFSFDQSFFQSWNFIGYMRKLTCNYLIAVVASSKHMSGIKYWFTELFVNLRKLLKIRSQLIMMLKFERIVKCELFDWMFVMMVIVVRIMLMMVILMFPLSW